jgi:predicted nucleotidyltransferase
MTIERRLLPLTEESDVNKVLMVTNSGNWVATDVVSVRENLSVYSKAEVDAAIAAALNVDTAQEV